MSRIYVQHAVENIGIGVSETFKNVFIFVVLYLVGILLVCVGFLAIMASS